jgi:hypothetical protein
MAKAISIESKEPGAIKKAIQQTGWLDGEEILAAGQLRQGKAPSTLGMVTGAAVIEVLRPRRSKQLPRHFVLAVTPERVVAFKASGGKSENGPYILRVRPGIEGSWQREGIRISGLEEGPKSSGGNLQVGSELIPVARPNLTGEPNTDELLATLGG